MTSPSETAPDPIPPSAPPPPLTATASLTEPLLALVSPHTPVATAPHPHPHPHPHPPVEGSTLLSVPLLSPEETPATTTIAAPPPPPPPPPPFSPTPNSSLVKIESVNVSPPPLPAETTTLALYPSAVPELSPVVTAPPLPPAPELPSQVPVPLPSQIPVLLPRTLTIQGSEIAASHVAATTAPAVPPPTTLTPTTVPPPPPIPLTTTPPFPTTKPSQPTPIIQPAKKQRGRKKGTSIKYSTNSEIRQWCLDFYISPLSLRAFCIERNIESKRRTISRNFNDSGLMQLKKSHVAFDKAERILSEYLLKREEKGWFKSRATTTTTTVVEQEEDASVASSKERGESCTFEDCAEEELRNWCLEFFSYPLTLEMFCQRRGFSEERERVLERHFRESGLERLKKALASRAAAEVALNDYFLERDESTKKKSQSKEDGIDEKRTSNFIHENDKITTRATTSDPYSDEATKPRRGRKKGETIKYIDNDRIRIWCLDYYASPLSLRAFCAQKGLDSKRRTISRNFKESGLVRLKKTKASRAAAELALQKHFEKKVDKFKGRMDNLQMARSRMMERNKEKKREEEAKMKGQVEREKWLREEYRRLCASIAKGDMWTFERFRQFCEKVENPFQVTINGFEIMVSGGGETSSSSCGMKRKLEEEEDDEEEGDDGGRDEEENNNKRSNAVMQEVVDGQWICKV